jgi:hypothetical protein
MEMSPEAISLVLVAAGLLVTLGGGFLAGLAWLIRRMDERFDKVDEQFNKVWAEFNQVQADLNEVKVSVARLEGPQPRLIFPR